MSIAISGLSYNHPNKEMPFGQLSFMINKGDKAALVGDNGMGKSILLQLIAGKLQPSGGEVVLSSTPWFVPQHLGQYNNLSIEKALQVDKKLAAIQAITKGLTDVQYFTELEDDWEIENRVHLALSQWQLDHLLPSQKMGDLSGGEKTKVFLAGIEIHRPEIILLDEPTNHLDVASRRKVYDLITSTRASILAVSHDRTLLNLLPQTYELSPTGIEVYGGNFDLYLEQKKK